MKLANKIWFSGKIVSIDKAPSLNFHQGLNYGACVYDGIRLYQTPTGPALFRLDAHLKRFFYSAHALRMELGLNQKELVEAIQKVIKVNKLQAGYIRPIAFYSEPNMGINILGAPVTVAIFVWPWEEKNKDESVTMKIVKTRRLDPRTVDFKAKISGYYVNGLLGFIEARESGAYLPLFLDTKGFVAEGAVNNIFILKDKSLYTPAPRSILEGVTRDTVIRIAQDMGLKVYEKNIRPNFFKKADEVFLTGTGIELLRVTKITRHFAKKPAKNSVFVKLDRHYKEATMGHLPRYRKWLTTTR